MRPAAEASCLTVALAVAQGFTARVFLRSTLPAELIARGAHLGVFAPAASLERLRCEFPAPAYSFYPLHMAEGRRDLLANYLRLLVADWRSTATYRLREREKWASAPWRRALWPLRRQLVAPQIVRRGWYALENALLPDVHHAPAMQRLRPDSVVTATPGVLPGDRRLLRWARRQGVPSVTYVQGWDNLTSKALIGARPDRLIVWNEHMRAEAVRLHGFRDEQIAVTGAAHFDPYFSRAGWRERAAFLTALGLDPHKRIVLFATAPRRYYPESGEVIELLLRAQASGALAPDVQLVVRLHPQAVQGPDANVDELRARFGERVFFDIPCGETGIAADYTADGIRHLGQLLDAAAVAITIYSSFIIDACIFDRPVVNIAFDAGHSKPYLRSVRRYNDMDHYAQVLRTGAVRSADGPASLVAEVRRYLAEPGHEQAQRRRLVQEICAFTDGRAGARIADAVIAAARRRPWT